MQSTIVTVLLASLAAVVTWKLKPDAPPPPPPPPVVAVQQMGVLTTLRVSYANVLEFNERATQGIPWTQWELRLGGTRVLLVARGECLLGTDLKQAKYEQVLQAERTATLSLPNPKILSARLIHEAKAGGSYFYAITNSGIASFLPGTESQTKAINQALRKGESDVKAACAKPELIEAAKQGAEAVLRPTVSATGWKIQTVWR
jgi:hypothetical protein